MVGGTIAGSSTVGGLIGSNQGTVSNCHAVRHNVTGNVGGLVEANGAAETVSNPRACRTGGITGNGYRYGRFEETMRRCYFYSTVSNCYTGAARRQ
jgi:hypothetical protein